MFGAPFPKQYFPKKRTLDFDEFVATGLKTLRVTEPMQITEPLPISALKVAALRLQNLLRRWVRNRRMWLQMSWYEQLDAIALA